MAKKDILERLSQPGDGRRTDGTGRGRGDAVTTRVSKGVVRRRAPRGEEAEASAPAEETSRPAVVRRRAARADEPAEAAAEAPPAAEAKAPAPEPEAPVKAEPVVVEKVETPVPVEAPAVVAKAEPAEKPAAETKPEPEPVVEAKPAPPAPEPAAPAPKPPEPPRRREAVRDDRPYRGLGSAVVSPPPGYDPSNPEAFVARQRREAAGPPPSSAPALPPGVDAGGDDADRGRGRGRRRVSTDTSVDRGAGKGRRARASVGPADLMRGRRRKKKAGPKSASPQPKAAKRKVRVDGAISVANLAHELSVKASAVIKKLMELGTLHTVNDMLDIDTATLVAAEFDYEVENVTFDESEFLQHIGAEEEEDEGYDPRPPVVTIMGHVDHGKTTLLDTIRRSRVAQGEAGGITQHIGAYQVERDGHMITFLDTPGHAAFSAMRARGASVTDIVVLVVAADDGVQPQTVEAINHAKAAGVPIVVAVNKCDKPGVNPENIRSRLGEHGLIPEEWGGEHMFANVSALKGEGIDKLLEAILLQAEVLELSANSDRPAEGTVIEAKMERGRGPVATVLVRHGTLSQGEHVVLGTTFGKVRAMMDHTGKQIKQAGPSTPVEIFGLSELPRVGDALQVTKNEKNARTLAEHRAEQERIAEMSKNRRRTLEDLQRMASAEERKDLLLVLKADVQGSLEALKAAIEAIEVESTQVRVLHDGVGNINESDVNLVVANDGLLIGFNVRIDARARSRADETGVKPELYTVIYDVLDRVEGALKGMLEPTYEEVARGTAEVRAVFNISRIGTVAGSYIMDGTVGRNHGARLMRDGKEIWKGRVLGLKRFKDDVREVGTGYECGISLDGFNAVNVGDIIQTFEMVRVDPT